VESETCRKELLIEIPVDVVQRESDTVAAQFARSARLPGFRPGHAPPSLIRQRYREEIRNEVVQSLLPKFFKDAVEGQKLSVVGQPHFDDLKFEDDQPLTVKATFEVFPEIELKNYKGLEAEEETLSVTEAEVDKVLQDLRDGAATFEVVADRAAEDGDLLMVNYEGQARSGSRSEPIVARDAAVELAGQGILQSFTDNLRGSRAGEVREFKVDYPQDYPQKNVAGRTVSYQVEVQSIKKKIVPPMDDDLAKTVSEFATLEELRAKVRQDLEKHHQWQVVSKAKQQLIEELLKVHQFPVPAGMVEEQLNGKLESMVRQLVAQKIDPRSAGLDWNKLREDLRPAAERDVRRALLLGKIADAEKIEVTDEEVDELIRELAHEGQETPAALKTRLTREGGLAKLQSSRRSQKALDFIYQNAAVKQTMGQSESIRTTE